MKLMAVLPILAFLTGCVVATHEPISLGGDKYYMSGARTAFATNSEMYDQMLREATKFCATKQRLAVIDNRAITGSRDAEMHFSCIEAK